MYSLTLIESKQLLNTLFLTGVSSFAVSAFLIAIIFIIKTKNKLKNTNGMWILIIITVSIPFTIMQIQNRTNIISKAQEDIKIANIELIKTAPNSINLKFTTSKPLALYIEYKDNKTGQTVEITPLYGFNTKINHSFSINNISEEGGQATIIINGYKYFLDNKPILIK